MDDSCWVVYLFKGFNHGHGPQGVCSCCLHVSWAVRENLSSSKSWGVILRAFVFFTISRAPPPGGDRVTFSVSALKEVLHHVSAARG